MTLHPAVRLLLWTGSVVVVQSLSGNPLRFTAIAVALLAATAAFRRTIRLVKRARWLLLALIVIFAWSTPGRLLWPEADWASPTAEGLMLALDHGARLLGLLMLVALLLEYTTQECLLSGLYSLLKPLPAVGLDRTRAAIRLGLVLRYSDQTLPRGRWREWLHGGHDVSAGGAVRLVLHPFRFADMAVAALAATLCLWVWLR